MAGEETDVTVLRERVRAADVDLADGDVAGYLEVGTALNLNAIAIGLGLEHVAYEPERFPGLVYTGTDGPTTVLLFADGCLVAVDATSPGAAERALGATVDRLQDLGLLDDAGTTTTAPVETVPTAADLEP